MIARLCLLSLLALLWLAGPPAGAQEALRIAALVNGDVISALDVEMRVRMAIMSSSLQDTPEVRERLRSQVLRGLIDDRLKLQEATRLGVKVNDKEIADAIGDLAQQNNMTVDQLKDALRSGGVLVEAVEDQIRAESAWGKIARMQLRPNVQISDAEIDEELARIRANQGKPEYLVAEIFLPVNATAEEEQVRQSAERLAEAIRNGADFRGVAQQFSESATAAGGGVLGWVRPGQLDPKLDQALRALAVGEVSPILRTAGGFYILQLRDQRQTGTGSAQSGRVTMRQVLFPLPANPTAAEIDKAEGQARDVAGQLTSCAQMEQAAAKLPGQPPQKIDNVDLDKLPGPLRQIALNLDLNQASPPVRSRAGFAVFMVCARGSDAEGGMPSRVDIANQLARTRLELLARAYLRDLRRAAWIELRN